MITGRGRAPCHHGEVLQGVFLDGRGLPRRGLVTLPMSAPVTRAVFTPVPGAPAHRIEVLPAGRAKAARAASLAVAECARRSGLPPRGGRLRLSGGVPVGLGMGSSTSDVIAAVRAVAAGFSVELPPRVVARLAVRAERAADPTMLGDRPVLFAQREGRVLEDLGPALPPTVVVGCLTGDGRPVNTLGLTGKGFPGEDVAAFERLRALLRRAVAEADAALLGLVGSESAHLNQRILPKAELGVLDRAALRCGGVGVQVAHSGNVAGVLFDASAPDLGDRLRHCARDLRDNGVRVTRIFRTPSGATEREHGRAHLRDDRQTGPGGPRRRTRLPAV
ncbi:GHMP family kinase ATP-binding protein [Actinorugispora endophytica]|uniref:Threonine kinase n=1 Tax=Actinorugispora endophytica TaxID=1605990 RepID=A0A4R6V2U8_9ACTN|nr:GHMP kinase [Actinorugispora endophytica]TDQ54272.1 threonine kinase [Actinorugispora endophytica]